VILQYQSPIDRKRSVGLLSFLADPFGKMESGLRTVGLEE
jgi:hypothetical protein